MATLFDNGSAFLRRVRRARNSREVTLKRGEQTTTGVLATPAFTRAESDDGEVVVERIVNGFLIDRAEYQLGGAEVMPKAGDLIRWESAPRGASEYRVVDGSERAYSYHGQDELTFRLEVVAIGPEPVPLTADTTAYTADSTTISADQTLVVQ